MAGSEYSFFYFLNIPKFYAMQNLSLEKRNQVLKRSRINTKIGNQWKNISEKDVGRSHFEVP